MGISVSSLHNGKLKLLLKFFLPSVGGGPNVPDLYIVLVDVKIKLKWKAKQKEHTYDSFFKEKNPLASFVVLIDLQEM